MICSTLFAGKIRKHIIGLSFAEVAKNMLSVKIIGLQINNRLGYLKHLQICYLFNIHMEINLLSSDIYIICYM